MRALREHIYVGMKMHGQSLMTDGAKALREVFGEHSGDFRGDPRRRGRSGGAADARPPHPVARPAVRRRADRPQPRLTPLRSSRGKGDAEACRVRRKALDYAGMQRHAVRHRGAAAGERGLAGQADR